MKSCLITKFLFKYLVLIFFFGCKASEGIKCDYKYSGIAVGWLKYFEIPATWYDARLRCALEGAILASPTNTRYLALLATLISDGMKDVTGKKIFTGIHATFSKGDYYTIDGIPLSEIPHKWEAFEPNNLDNDENCLAINNMALYSDVSCSTTLPYFCYKPENITEEMSNCGPIQPEYDYETRTGSCYKFHTVPRTFSRAFFACSAEGGHLAIINTETEAIVIRDMFRKHPTSSMIGKFLKDRAYIGVSDWGENGDWRTIYGQTLQETGYAKFSWVNPYRPLVQYCGYVSRNGQMGDIACDQSLAFICEKVPIWPGVCNIGDDV